MTALEELIERLLEERSIVAQQFGRTALYDAILYLLRKEMGN